MMKVFTVAAMLASMAVTTITQAQTYQWEDDYFYCSHKGDFDSKKYTAEQIKNSHLLLNSLRTSNLASFLSPLSIDGLDKLSMKDMDLLTKEYKKAKSNAARLNVVPEVKDYKEQLLKSIDGEYKQSKLTILAYLNPSEALKHSPKMCQHYIKPFLQSETAVQKKWKEFVEQRINEQRASEFSASYRDTLMTRYQGQKASNPAEYARIDLLTFGFGNCVNEQVYHPDTDNVFEAYQELNKTLFDKSYKVTCSEL